MRWTTVGTGGVVMLVVVAIWRGAAELLERRRMLMATGQLATRVAARRRAAVDRALARTLANDARTQDIWRGTSRRRVAVPVAGSDTMHRAVHAGRVRSDDVDDVGLLEAAMRRAADESPAVARSDSGAIVLACIGIGATFVPVVRPLADWAPALALVGAALVLAAWLVARRG